MIPRVTLALRLLLGAVFVYAAYTKLRQSWLLFALSIDSYQLLPEWAVYAVARTLPAAELALGILLIAGVWLRYLSIVAAAILGLSGSDSGQGAGREQRDREFPEHRSSRIRRRVPLRRVGDRQAK